jgi:hypothetical protein
MRARRMLTALIVIAGTALAVAPSAGATATPYVKHGRITVVAPSSTDQVTVTHHGKLPQVKQGEYVAYFTTFEGSPAGHCNPYGLDTGGNPTRPKRQSVKLDPSTAMEWGANETPNWCAGKWLAQAFVYKKKNGAYHPRLVFARKEFTIG